MISAAVAVVYVLLLLVVLELSSLLLLRMPSLLRDRCYHFVVRFYVFLAMLLLKLRRSEQKQDTKINNVFPPTKGKGGPLHKRRLISRARNPRLKVDAIGSVEIIKVNASAHPKHQAADEIP